MSFDLDILFHRQSGTTSPGTVNGHGIFRMCEVQAGSLPATPVFPLMIHPKFGRLYLGRPPAGVPSCASRFSVAAGPAPFNKRASVRLINERVTGIKTGLGYGQDAMRILLVEDDRRSRDFLVRGLAEEGYVVDSAADGEEGLHHALDRDYDLIILDVMMPKLDGWGVLSALRIKGKTMPVLFLTARDTVSDRVKGLTLGADDYLVKPFAWAEFTARIKTLLRRGPSRQPELLQVGDLEIDLPKMKARRGGRVIDLTAKEFQLLSLLARRSGDVLSRTTLAEQVWDMNFSTDSNAVDVAMGRLRRKVDEPFPHKLIHTVRGLGYTMEVRSHD